MSIRVLETEDLKKVLKIGEVIEGVRSVYEAKADGEIIVWPLIYDEFNDGKGSNMDIRSGGIPAPLPAVFQRVPLRMEIAVLCVPALPDDAAVLHDDRPHQRIRRNAARTAQRKAAGKMHVFFVGHEMCSFPVFKGARSFLPASFQDHRMQKAPRDLRSAWKTAACRHL